MTDNSFDIIRHCFFLEMKTLSEVEVIKRLSLLVHCLTMPHMLYLFRIIVFFLL